MGYKIDEAISKAEDIMGITEAIPVVGTLAGLSQALMGTGQLIVGVSVGTFCSIGKIFVESADLYETSDYAWSHAKHGLGNMLAGSLGAIPFVGTAMLGIRWLMGRNGSDEMGLRVSLGKDQDRKFIPYSSICQQQVEIVSSDKEANKINGKHLDSYANNLFNNKLTSNIYLTHMSILERRFYISLEEQKAMAVQAISEAESFQKASSEEQIGMDF